MGSMPPSAVAAKHSHYHKDVQHLDSIDVYRVLALFNVTDPCIQHAVKKLLVAGGRGAGKDIGKDVQESIDSLTRWQEMREEDLRPIPVSFALDLQTVTCVDCKGKPCTRTDACPYRAARYGGPATPQTPGRQG